MNRPIVRSYDKATHFEYSQIVAGGNQALYCLSPATVLLAYNLVKFYGGWRSRYVVETGQEPMEGLLESEWQQVNDLYQVALFELKDSIVSSNDFLTGMLEIANAIRDASCCDGPGGTGSGGAGSEPEAPTVAADDGVNPPAGFNGDYAAYQAYKCDVADWLFEHIIEGLEDLETFNWASFGALSVSAAVVAFIAVSGVAIPASLIFIAFGALLAYTGSVASLISAMQSSMDADKEDFVCALYLAGDVNTAMADFKAQATASFAGSPPDPFTEYLAGVVIDMFITPDLFNRLFDEDTSKHYPAAETDCSLCGVEVGVKFQLTAEGDPRGTGDLTKDGVQRTLSSTFDPVAGFHYITFGVYEQPSSQSYFDDCSPLPAGVAGTADENFDVIIHGATAGINQSDGTLCDNGSHSAIWGPSFPPFGVAQNVTWVDAINDVAFTMDVSIGDAGTL